jgi:hypothetical protein
MFAGVLGGAPLAATHPTTRVSSVGTGFHVCPATSPNDGLRRHVVQHLRSSRSLHVSLHTSKIMKPMAKGFAPHAAVLSFVADDRACRGEAGEKRPHVSSGPRTMNAAACAATKASTRRTRASSRQQNRRRVMSLGRDNELDSRSNQK